MLVNNCFIIKQNIINKLKVLEAEALVYFLILLLIL